MRLVLAFVFWCLVYESSKLYQSVINRNIFFMKKGHPIGWPFSVFVKFKLASINPYWFEMNVALIGLNLTNIFGFLLLRL